MKYIDIKGEIVDSGSEWLYDWYGIQATSPKMVQNALNQANGEDITIRINSGGGSVFAGCDIYNMLKTYKGNVNIEIHGLCASIAGVIAMSGKVKMSPVAQFMIHNVSGKSKGDYRDMEHTAETLKKANKTIANAFILKTGMSEEYIKNLMDNETWLTADECLELKIIDEIMYSNEKFDSDISNILRNQASMMYNSISFENDILDKLKNYKPVITQPKNNEVDFFMQQKAKAKLNLLNLKRSID